jgi:hypothetical protein
MYVDNFKSQVFPYVKLVVCRWIFESYVIKAYYINHRCDLAPPFLIFFLCIFLRSRSVAFKETTIISIWYRDYRTEDDDIKIERRK